MPFVAGRAPFLLKYLLPPPAWATIPAVPAAPSLGCGDPRGSRARGVLAQSQPRQALGPAAVTPAVPSCAQAHLQAPSAASGTAVTAGAIPATPQSLKLTYPETLDRIKEEFQFLQNQYHR